MLFILGARVKWQACETALRVSRQSLSHVAVLVEEVGNGPLQLYLEKLRKQEVPGLAMGWHRNFTF